MRAYRVNAARARSHPRRYHALARGLTIDRIDADVWNVAKSEILDWMGTELAGLKTSGAFALAEAPITRVEIATMEVEHGTGLSAPGGEYEIEASAVDIARQFEAAGRVLGNGLHDPYWRTHAERDALDVKIVLALDTGAMKRLEARAENAFDHLYDRFKGQVGALPEGRRGGAGVTSGFGWQPQSPSRRRGICRTVSISGERRALRGKSDISILKMTGTSARTWALGKQAFWRRSLQIPRSWAGCAIRIASPGRSKSPTNMAGRFGPCFPTLSSCVG
ncbi:hypothetical protein [Thiocapsa sp.]|uniref:hypothetical protein n=1 Tax=Thiocapsa sp. TaxID=2024551 RepID=UPI002D1C0344|nr:hypothetical protein [Thiocapsa sp.]HSO81697.1 hypothetical protein [Thiocapsa sp.]